MAQRYTHRFRFSQYDEAGDGDRTGKAHWVPHRAGYNTNLPAGAFWCAFCICCIDGIAGTVRDVAVYDGNTATETRRRGDKSGSAFRYTFILCLCFCILLFLVIRTGDSRCALDGAIAAVLVAAAAGNSRDGDVRAADKLGGARTGV